MQDDKRFVNADGVSVDELIDCILAAKQVDVFNNRGRALSPERFMHYSNVIVGDTPEIQIWYQIPLSYSGKLIDAIDGLIKRPKENPYASMVKDDDLWIRYACPFMLQIHPGQINKDDIYTGFLLRYGMESDYTKGFLIVKEFTDLRLRLKTKDLPQALNFAQNIKSSELLKELSPYKIIVDLNGPSSSEI